MDDLNEKISRLLSSPDSLQKIQAAMAALGQAPANESAPPIPSAPPDTAPVRTNQTDSAFSSLDIGVLTKLAPLLSSISQENDDSRLLHALRPYLHGDRAHRLDETVKLLQLTRLLPLLQQQGVLSDAATKGGAEHGG